MSRKLIFRFILLIAATLLFAFSAHAGVEPFTNSIRGALKKGDSLVVRDEKFKQAGFDWNTIQKQRVKNIISLQVFQDTNAVLPNAFSADVKLKVAYYAHLDQAEPLYINNVLLKVAYNKDSLHSSKLLDIHEFENGHWVKVTIEDITSNGGGTIPPFLQLTSQVIVDRQYFFDPARPLKATYTIPEPETSISGFTQKVITPQPTEVLVSLPPLGVDEYDIEWTTLDYKAGYDDLINSLITNQTIPDATLNELFRNNATRVTTSTGSYRVSINHYNNYLFFRIRGVQYQDGIRNEGVWDYKSENKFALVDITEKWHQPDLNWQYTATYAEEGKKKEVMSYFDGSLRSRQTVTINNEDKKAVVQESVYDQYGRAVAAILPAPINAEALDYYKKLHVTASGQLYTAADALGTDGCIAPPQPLAATSATTTILGAGKYYSPANGFLADENKPGYKYIPDAEGYPFAVTKYTPDNTGRIKWQGGVGKAFQPAPGLNRTTKYFYGKPLQEELDKLFGNEVGFAEHYLKNMVIDANGQVSVSYLDASGKTVATALAGDSPAALETLPGKPEKKEETRKLIRPAQFQYDYTNLKLSATTTYLAEVPGNATLLFDIEKLIYKYTKADWQICSNCYYDLTIKVFDDCGLPVYTNTATDFIGSKDPNCNEFGEFTKEIPIEFTAVGEYKIAFELALSRNVVESYTEKYIEQRKLRKDWKTEFRFIEDYAKLQDFSSCFDDCATCEEELGTREAFMTNGRAQLTAKGIEMDSEEAAAYNQWLDNLYTTLNAQCQALKANCNYSPCDRYEKLLKEDVSPFGQYAPFKATGTDFSTLEPLETEINVLYKYWRVVFSVLVPGTEAYEKESIEDDNGNHTSPHDASFTLAMLVKYWKPEWASKFITYHPEKCKLDFCSTNATSYNWDRQVQEEIKTVAAIATHNATLNATYSYTNAAWLVDKDPFFKPGGAGQYMAADMRTDLLQFSTRILKATTGTNKDLTRVVDYLLYCINPEGNTNTNTSSDSWSNCTPTETCRIKNREWDLYKEYYFQLKEKYYDLARNNMACAGACAVGTPLSLPSASTCPQKNEFSVVIDNTVEPACEAEKKRIRIVYGGINSRTLTLLLQYAAPYNTLGLTSSVTLTPSQTTTMFCVPDEVPLTAIYITSITCSGAPATASPCPFGLGGTLNLPASYQRSGNSYSYSEVNTATKYTYTIISGKPGVQPTSGYTCTSGTVTKTFYNCYAVQLPNGGQPISYYNVWVVACAEDPCANAPELTGMTQVSSNIFSKNGEYFYIGTPADCTSPTSVYANTPCLKVYVTGNPTPINFYNVSVTKCNSCEMTSAGSAAVVQNMGANVFKNAQGGLYEIYPNTTSNQVTSTDICLSPTRSWFPCFTIDLNGVKTNYYNTTVFYCAPPPPDPCNNASIFYVDDLNTSDHFYTSSTEGCITYRTDYYVFTGTKPTSPPYCSTGGFWSVQYACLKFITETDHVYQFKNAYVWTCNRTINTCGGGGGGGCELPQEFRQVAKTTKHEALKVEPCEVYLQTAKENDATDRYYASYNDHTLYIVKKIDKNQKTSKNKQQLKKLTHFTTWKFKPHFYIRTDSTTYLNFQNVWVAEYNPMRRTKSAIIEGSSASSMACPTISDFVREEVIIEDYYQGSSNYEEVRSVKEIYLKSKTGPVSSAVTFTVTTETQDCANCSYYHSTSTVTLNPGEERTYIGTFTLDYSVDLQFGTYYHYYYQNPMVLNDGVSCQPAPCSTPVLQSVTPSGGTEFEVTYNNLTSSVTSVLVQTSADGTNWTSHSGPIASPRTVNTNNTSGTWYFRVAAYCGGTPYYSNSISYTFQACPTVYQYKKPRFISIDFSMPTIDPLTEVNNGMAQLIQQINNTCQEQANQWMEWLQEGMGVKGLDDAKKATLRQRLIDVCKTGGDIDHPYGASTVRPNSGALYTSFKQALLSVLGTADGLSMEYNPWLLESPYPWGHKPQAVEQTLSTTSPALCDKLAQLQQQHAASGNGGTLYTYLANRFGAAMTLTEPQLNTLLKGCTNCKYLLEEEVPLPVFLEPGATGCITKGEWNAAQTALAGEFPAGVLSTTHDNYENIYSNYLNHRWGFTLTYSQYKAYADKLAGDAAAILCNQPVYAPVTVAPYQCFNSIMATVITNGQRDYEAYVEAEKKIFRTNYVATCLTAEPAVRLKAWQQTYHYTLYYYDQAGNLVKTVPPAGVKLLTEAEIARVDNNRKFDPANCTFNGPAQNTDKHTALQELSNSLDAAANRSLEFWLYNSTTGANQVLATTPDKKHLYQSCINGSLLNIDIYKLQPTSAESIDFVHSNHLTVDIGGLQPLHSWTHVVVQGSGLSTGLLQVFVNGKLRTAVAGDPPAGCSWEVTAGNPVVLPENLTTLKQLRYYNRLLTPSEISGNAKQPCMGSIPSPAYWARFATPLAGGEGTIGGTTTETQVIPVHPAHELVTTYQYNSMGQVVTQTTPDAGRSNFWYDRLGRLTASQNAEQLTPSNITDAANRYSYTKYDPLGRISEVGEKEEVPVMPVPGFLSEPERTAFLNSAIEKQVTATVYDVPATGTGVVTGIPQTHLRKRVAASLFKPLGNGPVESATYYSYDAAGNVAILYQQVPILGLKHVQYQYDLVSGKVNAVLYQHNEPDAFYYQYGYDAENRLITAYSSKLPYITGRGQLDIRSLPTTHIDAEYQYYLHGPLMRMELGKNKVQGVDYAYTLQGWLKGINSQQLDVAKDMGGDNWTNNAKNKYNGRDVLGFSLGYYEGDFKPIGGSTAPAFGLTYTSVPGDVTGRPLYNGNISHTTLALNRLGGGEPVGYTYGYDQLNRLRELRHHPLTAATTAWNSASAGDPYRESYSYDANGNILTLLRHGTPENGKPLEMDQLTYHYQPHTNKLSHVNDAIDDWSYETDIDNQNEGNYGYDKIGNLVRDSKENINTIRWTVYGKIASLIKDDPFTTFTDNKIYYKYDAAGQRIAKQVLNYTGWPEALSNSSTTYYVRDAQGNTLAVYKTQPQKDKWGKVIGETEPVWTEQHLYGSSRLGMYNPMGNMRSYELTNHLGNVLATVSEYNLNLGTSQEADVMSMQDYYAFGMQMPERIWGYGYRYGFNGKEDDSETGTQDYGMRIYNPGLGRFLSVDPIAKDYPWNSPYSFAEGDPVNFIDLDGLERAAPPRPGSGRSGGPIIPWWRHQAEGAARSMIRGQQQREREELTRHIRRINTDPHYRSLTQFSNALIRHQQTNTYWQNAFNAASIVLTGETVQYNKSVGNAWDKFVHQSMLSNPNYIGVAQQVSLKVTGIVNGQMAVAKIRMDNVGVRINPVTGKPIFDFKEAKYSLEQITINNVIQTLTPQQRQAVNILISGSNVQVFIRGNGSTDAMNRALQGTGQSVVKGQNITGQIGEVNIVVPAQNNGTTSIKPTSYGNAGSSH